MLMHKKAEFQPEKVRRIDGFILNTSFVTADEVNLFCAFRVPFSVDDKIFQIRHLRSLNLGMFPNSVSAGSFAIEIGSVA
jgi:hypothetical protein